MNNLPALYPNQMHLLVAARPTRDELVNAAIARLACSGPVRLLDGGNCFQAHRIARLLRRSTPDLSSALGNIHIARAFTCYQVVTLLAETPAVPVPTLVLDLLTTFQDENVPLHERRRLLSVSLRHLRRLSQRAPTLVSVAPEGAAPKGSIPQGAGLLELLEEAADHQWRFEPQPSAEPLRLL